MNVTKIREALNYLVAEPLRLDMGVYKSRAYTNETKPPCGTVCCLAGAAIILEASATGRKFHSIAEPGARLFEINLPEATRLFHVQYWPTQFKFPFQKLNYDYYNIKHPHILNYIAKARIGLLQERVAYFIASQGEQ